MDFFTHQQQARRQSALLVALFSSAVLAIVAATYFSLCVISPVASTAESEFHNRTGQTIARDARIRWWQPELIYIATGISVFIIGLGSLYKIAQLRGGGSVVATALGGTLVSEDLDPDPHIKQLLNIVEEMSLASGIAVPPVFVMRNESSINAFAAGDTPNNAVIGVSQGAVDSLSRDELQGVIAHEYSHILNGDMRTNIRMMGVLHGILLIAIIGFYLIRFAAYAGSGSRNKNNPTVYLMLLGAAAVVIGSVGLFFARIIKASLSRQREFLADASAVQFTRNPDGIANALNKIRVNAIGSRIKNPEAEVASHLFFGNARGASFFSLFSTHPPLEERIRRISPILAGKLGGKSGPQTIPTGILREDVARVSSLHRESGNSARLDADKRSEPVVASGRELHLAPLRTSAVERLALDSFDSLLISAAHHGYTARFIVAAILFSTDGSIRKQQLELVEKYLGTAAKNETLQQHERVTKCSRLQRMQLLDICHASLMSLSISQVKAMQRLCSALVAADGQIELFEFMVERVLTYRMNEHSDLQIHRRGGTYKSYRTSKEAIGTVLSAIAHASGLSSEICEANFNVAMRQYFPNGREYKILGRSALTLHQVGAAMDQLAGTSLLIKEKIIDSAILLVGSDQKTTMQEMELIRALSATLALPTPAVPEFVT